MTISAVRRNRLQAWASGGAQARSDIDAAARRWYRRRRVAGFFRSVVSPGDLVFDVGANVGEWTTAFRRLGAEVVSVEPQGACVDRLVASFSNDPLVHVVPEAVGSQIGTAELSAAHPGMQQASMAADWMAALVASGRMPASSWSGQSETVSVTTLDRLIEHYGVPVYCKVDVEGFESEVIAGLSRALPLLSFEFHSEVLGNVDRIVARLRRLGRYDFNYSLGEWPGLDRAGWIGPHALLEALGELGDEAWGNLFAVQRH